MIALTRSTRRLIVLGVLAALSGTGQAVVSATDAAATIIQPAPARPPQDIAEATEWFRMDLGLRSDRSFVLDVATDPSAGRADYGYPLLPEEVAYLERREVARAQLDATQDYLSGLSRTVAGLYLDNQAPRAAGIDLTLVVAFTDNAESHRAELTRLLPKGVALALKTAKYSKAELDSIVEDVIADREWHKSLGIDVYVAGTDERRDRVLLGISEPNESAAAALASRYGADRIYVYVSAKPELDACIRTNCPPPWVAGLKIDSTSNPATGNHCTSGFRSSPRAGTGSS